jgi:hypothetical protein
MNGLYATPSSRFSQSQTIGGAEMELDHHTQNLRCHPFEYSLRPAAAERVRPDAARQIHCIYSEPPIVAFWVGGVIKAVSTTQQSDSETSGAGTSSRLKLIAYASAQSLAGFFMYMGAFVAVLAL